MFIGLPYHHVWQEGVGVVLQQQGPEERLLMNSLRSSSGFTQGELLSIFALLGIEASMRPKKTTCRRDVLAKLCELVGSGDLVFKDLVLEQSKQKIAKNEFYSAIFEQLDSSEKSEFKDLLKDMSKEKKAEVQKKWNGMLKEKIAERKVT